MDLLAGSGTAGHADGAGAAARFDSPIDLALSGNTLYVADMNNHLIRAVNLDSLQVDTIAGGGSGEGDYVDAPGTTVRFNSPSGLAVDPSGTTLYVADSDNHRIQAIDIASKTVNTIAGSGNTGDYAEGAGKTAAKFNVPLGLALSGTKLYVADSENRRIREVDLADPDYTVSTIAGDGSQESRDGIGTAARFWYPTGISARGSTLYVASGTEIRKLEYR